MTTSGLLGLIIGAAVAGGLWLMIDGLTHPPTPAAHGRRRWRVGARGSGGWSRWRWPTAVFAGVGAWAVVGWPVAGAITTVTILGLPVLLTTSRTAARSIDRLEALEAWTRHLADVLLAGAGLEQAITVTARNTPTPIQAEVTALTARLGARWSTEDALRAYGTDLHDASADLLVAALLLAARRRGPGLGRVLTSLADSLAEEVAMRRRVEADRAKPRATARAVTLITLAVVALGSLNTDYVAAYATPLGQAVLAVIAVGFTACLAWMRALTLTPAAPRVLSDASSPSTDQVVGVVS